MKKSLILMQAVTLSALSLLAIKNPNYVPIIFAILLTLVSFILNISLEIPKLIKSK